MRKDRQDRGDLPGRFRGAVLGAAIADALALPYQHYSHEFLSFLSKPLAQGYAKHHSGFHPTGQYSDDTQLMLAVIDSILEAGGVEGESIASHMVSLWRDNLLVERDESYAEAMERLAKGITHWERSGLEPGHAEITPLARVVGLALWDHEDLDSLSKDVKISTALTHQDQRVAACAAAAAAAIASNLRTDDLVLGSFLDSISAAAARFDEAIGEELLDFPRVLSMTEYRARRHFESLFADERYPPSQQGLGEYCVPGLWTAIYFFLKAPHEYEMCVEKCITAGGHVDTPALLAGAISGALIGEQKLPQTLVDQLLNGPSIRKRADRLYGAWEAARPEAGAGSDR